MEEGKQEEIRVNQKGSNRKSWKRGKEREKERERKKQSQREREREKRYS